MNQHYVPQFYFRNFSTNSRNIGLLLTSNGRIVPHAPIKGQCSKNNFHGSNEVESLISKLEGMFAHSIRIALKIAWDDQDLKFDDSEICRLFQCIVFQRMRTELEIVKNSDAHSKFLMLVLKREIAKRKTGAERDQLLNFLEKDLVEIVENPVVTVIRNIQIALELTPLISDLRFILLRNQTDYPFLFGDSPVIYYNNYLRHVRHRGVLGLQCKGLQIFYPLDSKTCLFMLDGDTYSDFSNGQFIHDIIEKGDVSQINALQLHHCLNAIYFRDNADYVSELWNVHGQSDSYPTGEYHTSNDWAIDGKRMESEIHYSFQPQIAHELNLSFLAWKTAPKDASVFEPRSQDVYDRVQSQTGKNGT